jgi:hypothetical protein
VENGFPKEVGQLAWYSMLQTTPKLVAENITIIYFALKYDMCPELALIHITHEASARAGSGALGHPALQLSPLFSSPVLMISSSGSEGFPYRVRIPRSRSESSKVPYDLKFPPHSTGQESH